MVAQPAIRTITIDQRSVFDTRSDDWFFAGSVAEALHSRTRDYVVDDELLFTEGEALDDDRILETERNLRRTGLFRVVSITVDTVSVDSVDVRIFTRDRWSLLPAVLVGAGGGIANYGAKLEELNLAGTGTALQVAGLYRTENAIGWEGLVSVGQRRLFRSEVGLYGELQANRLRTDQRLAFVKPFRTLSTPWAGAVTGWNSFGQDFAYTTPGQGGSGAANMLLPFHQRGLTAWWSTARGEADNRLFMTFLGQVDDTRRTVPASRQAFDNTAQLLLSFVSVSQNFRRSQFLNGYETEDVQTGGYGNVVLGRLIALDSMASTLWYAGATGELSDYVTDDLYLFGRVGGGSGFGLGGGRYTALDVAGIGHWRWSPHIVLTARMTGNVVWNWDAFHQLILDNDAGLRGYAANAITGDNRTVTNVELRWFPQWKAWIFGLSGVVFHDMGTVWNQGLGLDRTRWHHSIGAGIRLHNLAASGSDAIMRLDVAYNVDERRIAGIIFTTNQLFSAFGLHQYRPPSLLGADIDLQ